MIDPTTYAPEHMADRHMDADEAAYWEHEDQRHAAAEFEIAAGLAALDAMDAMDADEAGPDDEPY